MIPFDFVAAEHDERDALEQLEIAGKLDPSDEETRTALAELRATLGLR
jgi:hypothetical protein